MTLLEENICFFKNHDPSVFEETVLWAGGETYSVEVTRRGEVFVKIQGTPVHSKVSPSKEAERFLQKHPNRDFNVHFGFGLGHFYRAQKNKRGLGLADTWEVLIYEPDPVLLRTALHHVSFRSLFRATRARIFGDLKRFLRITELEYAHFSGFEMLILPYHLGRHRNQLHDVQGRFKSLIEQRAFFLKSEQALSTVFFSSTLKSMKYWNNSYTFDPLFLRYAEKPAVVLSPGPSLEKNLSQLLPYLDYVMIFAVSRVAGILEKYGVQPDFLVHIEAKDFYRLIDGKFNLSESVFLLQEQAEQKYFQFPCRRTIAYHNSSNRLARFLIRTFPELKRMHIPSGGSVSHDAFSLAVFMGCNPVILMGQDLALSGNYMYSDRRENYADKLNTAQIKGFFGPEVTTIDNYEKFHTWFQESAEPYREHFMGLQLINATEGGADIAGFEAMGLRHVAKIHFKEKIPKTEILDSALKSAPKHFLKSPALRHAISGWLAGFQELEETCEKVLVKGVGKKDLEHLLQIPFEKELFRAYSGVDLVQEYLTIQSNGKGQGAAYRSLVEYMHKKSDHISMELRNAFEEFG